MIKKSTLGITRNRTQALLDSKASNTRKKKRFQNIGKQEDEVAQNSRLGISKEEEDYTHSLLSTAQNSSVSSSTGQLGVQSAGNPDYVAAKEHLQKIVTIRTKYKTNQQSNLIPFLVRTCRKQNSRVNQDETEELQGELDQALRPKYQRAQHLSYECKDKLFDQTLADFICSVCKQHVMAAEKCLNKIKQQVQSDNQTPAELKVLRNVERSLTNEIRQSARSLRNQQKDYFGKVKSFQQGMVNAAIELTPQQKENFKEEQAWADLQQEYQEILDRERDEQINQLVKSINKLSAVYKQLNQLVIDQGSIIDRIDYNIDQTVKHTHKAVEHLQKAHQHVTSPTADRCIRILMLIIVGCAIALGFKWGSSS